MNAAATSFTGVISAIKSAAAPSLPFTQHLHAVVIKLDLLLTSLAISNHLLNLYCKCRSLRHAHRLFDVLPHRNLVSYSTLISANSKFGSPFLSIKLMIDLKNLGFDPNQYVFSSSIVACSKLGSLTLGKQIHSQLTLSGFEDDPFVKSTLIDMYSGFGDLNSAASVFQNGSSGDPIVFNSMVTGCVRLELYEDAIHLLKMAKQDSNFRPTVFTFGSLVKACTNLERAIGEQLHGFIVKAGFEVDCFVGTSLIDMYGSYGDVESLEPVFKSLVFVDTPLYNAIIVGLLKNGHDDTAWDYFRKLKIEGLKPTDCTFSAIINACAGIKVLSVGKAVHGLIEKSRFRDDLVVNTALIDFYMKCGEAEEGCTVFNYMNQRNIVSYNSMISGLGQNGKFIEAMRIFVSMNRKRLDVDLCTFVGLMSSCRGQKWAIYVHALKHGFGFHPMVQNTLLDSLLKDGDAKDALDYFSTMKDKSVVSWTTIISGLANLGVFSAAIEFFELMRSTGISPNSFTLSSVLKACSNSAGLYQGLGFHGCVIKYGVFHEYTSSSLLDMYARCGNIEDSRRLFDELETKGVVAWNTMITSYAQHGYGFEALELYSNMEMHNISPNNVTFVSLLSACSHSGLISYGIQLFESMRTEHNLIPEMEHYVCMVDMFGRAGMLDRAKFFIDSMPIKADVSVWIVFLSACKVHGDIELATIARQHVREFQGEDNSTLVLISNAYSAVGNWADAEGSRKKIGSGCQKEVGLSWVQV